MYKKAEYHITKGTSIQGKWHHQTYTVVREIGKGMIGTVYLCKQNGKLVALKLSTLPMTISREIAVLKKLNKVRDQHLGPFLFDVDDWEAYDGKIYAFYVMEYIQGESLKTFIQRRRSDQVGTLFVQLLERFEQLHQQGLVFGDVKPEHIRIVDEIPRIRFLDVGGMTKMGQSVKEYSNFYDRAYWQLGSRKAEPSYDLFALVMVFIAIYYPSQFRRTTNARSQIISAVRRHPILKKYEYPFQKVIDNAYPTVKAMKQDMLKITNKDTSFKRQERILPQTIAIIILSGCYYFISLFLS